MSFCGCARLTQTRWPFPSSPLLGISFALLLSSSASQSYAVTPCICSSAWPSFQHTHAYTCTHARTRTHAHAHTRNHHCCDLPLTPCTCVSANASPCAFPCARVYSCSNSVMETWTLVTSTSLPPPLPLLRTRQSERGEGFTCTACTACTHLLRC